jgi:hypothetical protein
MDARVKPAHDAECVATPDKTAALFCAAACFDCHTLGIIALGYAAVRLT